MQYSIRGVFEKLIFRPKTSLERNFWVAAYVFLRNAESVACNLKEKKPQKTTALNASETAAFIQHVFGRQMYIERDQ